MTPSWRVNSSLIEKNKRENNFQMKLKKKRIFEFILDRVVFFKCQFNEATEMNKRE